MVDLQLSVAESWTEVFTTPSRNFTVFPYQGVNPSDPVGDVGPNHYIHASNASGSSVIRIFDKSEPAPVQLALDHHGGDRWRHRRLQRAGSATRW